MKFENYKYIYPPRPENKIPHQSLITFDKMGKFMAQPKFNGSSMEIFTDGQKLIEMNRHKEPIAHKMDKGELIDLHKEKGWMVLCGELMNKNKKDETNNYWNHKYVIWDIIVYAGEHLLGITFEERFKLLQQLYPNNPVKKYLHQISENCFRVDSIQTNFLEVYNDITQYDMYEGLVLKRKDSMLENGTTSNNNVKSQLKCRKETKNYNF